MLTIVPQKILILFGKTIQGDVLLKRSKPKFLERCLEDDATEYARKGHDAHLLGTGTSLKNLHDSINRCKTQNFILYAKASALLLLP